MSMPYFEQLESDFASAGMYSRREVRGTVASVDDAVEILNAPNSSGKVFGFPMAPRTALGKRTRDLWREGIVFDIGDFPCCPDAETTLLTSLDTTYHNKTDHQAIIVTQESEPVAIIKQKGERTAYALTDYLAFGIVRGAFCSPRLRHDYYRELPRARRPWQIPVENFGRGFMPMRFSLFATPKAARARLKTENAAQEGVLDCNHSQLKDLAQYILHGAVPARVIVGSLVPDN